MKLGLLALSCSYLRKLHNTAVITLNKGIAFSLPPLGLRDLVGGVGKCFGQVLGVRKQDPKVV